DDPQDLRADGLAGLLLGLPQLAEGRRGDRERAQGDGDLVLEGLGRRVETPRELGQRAGRIEGAVEPERMRDGLDGHAEGAYRLRLAARISRVLPRLRAACLAVLLAAALGAGCRRATANPERPSVLLVTIDTIRADHVGAYGGTQGATPAIDAFARDAVLFEQAIAAAPL